VDRSRFDLTRWHAASLLVGVWVLLISSAISLAAQQASQPSQSSQPAQPNSSTQTSPAVQAEVSGQGSAAGKKIIRDQAEYNSFIAATNTQDPKEQAEAFESFAEKYPKSVVATDALEQAMSDWQKVGDSVKVLEVAKEILASDAGNVRAMAIVVALDRVSAAQGDSSALDELCLKSTGGMREVSMWQKPKDMSDADFAKLHKQMEVIFTSAAGYCALEQRNYSQAHDWFLRVVQMDATDLQDMYLLAIADLELNPIDVNGFWYCARAIRLAEASPNEQSAGGMEAYCKPKYIAYHGSEEGWNGVMEMGAVQMAPPAEFAKAITAAPKLPQPAVRPQN
jgi:hypothetical protein